MESFLGLGKFIVSFYPTNGMIMENNITSKLKKNKKQCSALKDISKK
jgi:hypothetical protein